MRTILSLWYDLNLDGSGIPPTLGSSIGRWALSLSFRTRYHSQFLLSSYGDSSITGQEVATHTSSMIGMN